MRSPQSAYMSSRVHVTVCSFVRQADSGESTEGVLLRWKAMETLLDVFAQEDETAGDTEEEEDEEET